MHLPFCASRRFKHCDQPNRRPRCGYVGVAAKRESRWRSRGPLRKNCVVSLMRAPRGKPCVVSGWLRTPTIRRLEEIHPWRRGGGETYLYRFKVIGAAQEHDVLLKAVTAFSTTRTLRELVDEWVCRRHLLASGGVRTPKFYFSGRGLLVEQYVEEKLAHRLRCRPANSVELTDQVFALAADYGPARFFTHLCLQPSSN